MSSKKIKQVLAAKGYELIDLQVQRGNAVCETEWLVLLPKNQQEKILELNSGFFIKQDFSNGYLGGNAEYVEECLDELPDLKEYC
ncbi:hypothetical protein [Acinetobacter soli]|uniref:hypothetical protein n=1 Tax=Acinetobacter soli TaxID=487316 RepID=UPI000B4C5A27|nr:hypothetical protein [Acinetobacter soli]